MTAANTTPTHAMVLAAGLGTRMRPITDTLPKPLVRVAGQTMLDRALDKLAAAGIERAVVNTHYLAAQIAEHVRNRKSPSITFSHEEDVLETGGGVQKALPDLGGGPFFVVNSDSIWDDGPIPALARLAAAWDDASMDALLLVHPTVSAVGYHGRGDFFLDGVRFCKWLGVSRSSVPQSHSGGSSTRSSGQATATQSAPTKAAVLSWVQRTDWRTGSADHNTAAPTS